MAEIWRELNKSEDGRAIPSDEPHFGTFSPNAVQRMMIAMARGSVLKRGVFRKSWTDLIQLAGQGTLDIEFRNCAYRIRGDRNLIDYGLLLNPDYNHLDIDFLLDGAQAGSNFLDIGSNVGLYSLPMAKSAPAGITVSIDANPLMAQRLLFNAEGSGIGNLRMISCAVSDQDGRATLQIRKDDTAIVAVEETADGDVPVRTLNAIVSELGLASIHGLKIDIEGHEDKALVPFLSEAPDSQLPRRIVIEKAGPEEDYPGCTAAFGARGYVLEGRTRNNSLYRLPG
ncbi:MAG: FkbM family methyltransferase [Pseudomonadota bacterium]